MNITNTVVPFHDILDLRSQDYINIAKEYDLDFEYRGPWISYGRSLRIQGWKIHLSSNQESACELLKRVIPILQKSCIPFKFVKDPKTLLNLNEGGLGLTQIGKCITVYPLSDDQSLELSSIFIELTKGLCGPQVITDRHLGGVVYVRYGSFNPYFQRNRLGQLTKLLYLPDNSYREDKYSTPYEHYTGFPDIFSKYIRQEGNERKKLIDLGYLLLKLVHAKPTGNVYLAIDIREQNQAEVVILKEGRRNTGEDIYNRDARERLKHEEFMHKKLAGCPYIPICKEYFEYEENGYLSLEFIDGFNLLDIFPGVPYHSWNSEERTSRLTILKDLCIKIENLHQLKCIHRDLTPRNIRISSTGKIYFIDLELSWFVDMPGIPFAQGTPGFTSPEQRENKKPSVKDDVFAIGSLLVWMLGSVNPQRLVMNSSPNLERQLLLLTGTPPYLSSTIRQCINQNANMRPSIHEIIDSLDKAKKDLSSWGGIFITIPERKSSKSICIRDIQEMITESFPNIISGMLTEVSLDENTNLWQSSLDEEQHNAFIKRNTHDSNYGLLRSTYRGISGSLYVLSRLQKSRWSIKNLQIKVHSAIDWLLAQHPTRDTQLPGLYFGEAGIAVSIAEIVSSNLIEPGNWLTDYLSESLQGPLNWPDITHGAAGQGIASLLCADLINNTNKEKDFCNYASNAIDYLISTQDENGSWKIPEGVEGMSGKIYTGFAHGVAGIIYFLAEFYLRYPDKYIYRSLSRGIEWLLQQSTEYSGQIAWRISTDSQEVWNSWCHGSPGIVLALLKCYRVMKDKKYLELVNKALVFSDTEEKRSENLSTCCGVTGLGEIFLEIYKVTEEERWLLQAAKIAKFLISIGNYSKNNNIVWPVINSHTTTADLMIGNSGVIHFLLRMINPKKYSFPLLTEI